MNHCKQCHMVLTPVVVVLLSCSQLGPQVSFKSVTMPLVKKYSSLSPSVSLWTCVKRVFYEAICRAISSFIQRWWQNFSTTGQYERVLAPLSYINCMPSKHSVIQYSVFVQFFQLRLFLRLHPRCIIKYFFQHSHWTKMLTRVHLFLLSWWARPHFSFFLVFFRLFLGTNLFP